MYFRNVGTLCTPIETLDKFNRPQRSGYTERAVICNEKGVKRSEFYQAQAAGYKPELCIELMACDYEGEGYFRYNDKLYKVIRTYPTKGERIELVCNTLVSENE